MWRSVLAILEEDGCVGTSLPVACHHHPDNHEEVKKPGQLPRIAPDGTKIALTYYFIAH